MTIPRVDKKGCLAAGSPGSGVEAAAALDTSSLSAEVISLPEASTVENDSLLLEDPLVQELPIDNMVWPGISQVKSAFGPLKQNIVYVNSDIVEKGLVFTLKQGVFNHSFPLVMPEAIWSSFPDNLKKVVRDNIAHLASVELGVMFNLKKIKYDTPLPQFKSFFVELVLKCLAYSGDCASGKTMDYISRLCNLEFSFDSQTPPYTTVDFAPEDRSVNTITFGKESLVSYGLCKEIGLNPLLVTVIEPDMDIVYRDEHLRSFENKHKEDLRIQFEKEFEVQMHKIYNGLGDMNFYAHWGVDETELGWSSQLTQYMFFLLPFCYSFKSKYMVFGNENSCDRYYYSKEGFKCYPVYDQSAEWIGHMNAMLHTMMNGRVKATSLVQSIQEIAVAKVLYQRYPELAKYQMSCHADSDSAEFNRWCNTCSKCARIYTFMKALGFDPASVGLKDMFSLEFKKHFSLFSQTKDMRGFDGSGLGRDEQLFAFYLAAQRGATGDLIDLFKKDFYEEAAAREEELRTDFFKVHKPLNVPPVLWKKIKPIFEEELRK
ncbi:TPA: hypothetical protein HA242_04615 [Candidatus Woesearchaeota archaeon]|nr:hypothetical protein [Candidatus Woesearchaeota archaeon]HIG93708.1 hypothetical protein [Candidatus Woesearchaeota archaeon]HIH12981.1 hypothetical protein [Candidatus Woesearchaeota archaeon]